MTAGGRTFSRRTGVRAASVARRTPDDSEHLELDKFVPYYLIAIANRWTTTSSRTYLRQFGIGIVEWRILASLDAVGTASSLDVVQMVGTDAAAVSKAMRSLESRKLVIPAVGKFEGRTKPYTATHAGQLLTQELRSLARRREEVLLQGLTEVEKLMFIELLKKLHAQLPKLQDVGIEGESSVRS